MDVPVERREALLPEAVDVVGELVAGLLRRREERAEERVVGRSTLEGQRPAVAAIRIVGRGREAVLHPLEVGQAMGVVPGRHARVRGPALVVERVAALEDHPVDARRAAEHPAAGVVDAPAAHRRLGLGLVAPVVEARPDRERERRGHVDEDVEAVVATPGLEDEDARRGSAREPVGERGSGGAAADDDEVVAAHTLRVPTRSEAAERAPPGGSTSRGRLAAQAAGSQAATLSGFSSTQRAAASSGLIPSFEM